MAYDSSRAQSPPSNVLTYTVPSSAVVGRFVKADAVTRGNWRGVFGSEGYRLAQVSTNILPSYDGLSVGAPQWTWEAQSTAVRALMRPDSTNRILACWYSFSAVNIDLTINDGRLHRTSVYFVDASGGREQTIEVIDRSTGQTLDSRLLTNFVSGVYLTWDITGNVSIRLTPKTVNAVASAVFFDPSPSGTG